MLQNTFKKTIYKTIIKEDGMDWDKLRTFYTVAKVGTFTNAGDALNLSQSAVSRQISALESSLGIKLFNRHARGLILTEPGETLYNAVQEVFTKLSLTEATLTENKTRPTGSLKVTTTPAFGSNWLAPRLYKFIEKYPDITISIRTEDVDLNLRTREADVAIRMHETVQYDLIQRHLASFPLRVYASKDYIKNFGHPRTLKDLGNHTVIGYDMTPTIPIQHANWLFQSYAKYEKKRLPMNISMNSLTGNLNMVKSGLGICALPSFVFNDSKQKENIVEVMDDVESPSLSAYYVYPVELRSSKKVRAFRDFLMEEMDPS